MSGENEGAAAPTVAPGGPRWPPHVSRLESSSVGGSEAFPGLKASIEKRQTGSTFNIPLQCNGVLMYEHVITPVFTSEQTNKQTRHKVMR